MKEVFKLNESQTYDFRSQNVLKVERYNTVRYGKKSLRILGPQIWNSLPNEYTPLTKLLARWARLGRMQGRCGNHATNHSSISATNQCQIS